MSIARIICISLASSAMALGAASLEALAGTDELRDGSTLPDPAPQVSSPDLTVIWTDPGFQRAFVGGYGINPDVEPRVSQDDMALLELVRQLMPDELAAAERLLADSMRPDTSAVINLTLGGIRFQQERLDEALNDFRDAVAKYPSFRRAYRNIGLISTRKDKHEDAIAAFNRMIELGGADAYSYGLLGYCHSARQDYQPAEAAYRTALLLQPENVEWRLGLTRSVYKQAKYEDAASLLDVLIAAFPDKGDFWMLQAHTYLGLKQPMKAAVNLEALDTLGKSTTDSLYTLGDIYLTESLPDLALSAFARALHMAPGQPAGRPIRSAELLAARGGSSQASLLLEQIKSNVTDTLSDADRRRILKLQARLAMSAGADSDANAAILQEAIALDPLDGEALMLLGQHYSRNGKPDEAILQYERAARIDSFAASAKVAIARVFVGQSRFTEALPLLRDAQSLRPRDDVARYIEQVERASRSKR
jgi:tetratricopeptide (TPR) repeat protein